MSAPTRGMVAGQPIQTQAQTREFDEGYERVFGTQRNKARGRFVVRDGQVVNVASDWTDTERRAPTATEELTYGGVRATDGAPINTRRKHREYLKQHGLTMASDYPREYQEKEAARRERHEDKERRESIERTWFDISGY